MAEFLLDSVRLHENDATGAKIIEIYAKVSGRYAVYRVPGRVMIQWADSTTPADDGGLLGPKQRMALQPVECLRGEISGLIDGWHDPKQAVSPLFWRRRNPSRGRRYDRLVADALGVALSGDVPHAVDRLGAIRDRILDERVALGRVQYILTAFLIGLLLALLSYLVGQYYAAAYTVPSIACAKSCTPLLNWSYPLVQRWAAAGFGAFGAFLSVALQIRQRDVKPDLETSNNIVDASLRIAVGAMSAVTLAALLQSKLFAFSVGGALVAGTLSLEVLIVVSILAGFTERLVSEALSKASLQLSAVGGATGATPAAVKASEGSPGISVHGPISSVTGGSTVALTSTAPPAGDDVDSCSAAAASAIEATADVELPQATGGMEAKG